MQIELEIGWNSRDEASREDLKLINKTSPDDRCASKCTGSPTDGGNLAKLSSAEKIAKNIRKIRMRLCSANSEPLSGVVCKVIRETSSQASKLR